MAISLIASPGGLFTRLGRTTFVVNSINSFRGTSNLSAASICSLGTGVTNILGQYLSTNQSVVDSLNSQLEAARSANSGFVSILSNEAQATVIAMANDDTPLSSLSISKAMTLLISQMRGSSDTVNANAVTVAVTTGSSNTGTAICIASVVGPDGKNREYVFDETITLTASTDSQSSTATEGSETWTVAGEAAQGDKLAWDWPKGSGVGTSVTAAAVDVNNKLVNGDFEDFTTTNLPDYWTVLVGVAGTDILESTTVFAGSKSLRILGDGSTLSAIRQEFDDSTNGTGYKLLPSTVYALNAWIRTSSTPAAGVLAFSLTNGSGTIMTNDASTSQTISKSLTAVSTTWTNVSGWFQTPSIMPSTPHYIKIHLTTAITNTHSVFIDNLSLIAVTPIYTGGPYVAVFPGATATAKGDTFSLAVTNDYGGKLQTAFWRFFSMPQLGMQLPSNAAGGETISDSLVT